MDERGRPCVAVCLAALYARSSPGWASQGRAKWPRVVSVLSRSDVPLGAVPEALRAAGLWDEAARVGVPGALAWAARAVAAGSVVTAVCDPYPSRLWKSLGPAAPPVFFVRGRVPRCAFVGVVGSRRLGPSGRAVAERAVCAVLSEGFGLVSGGAAGADSVAVAEASRLGAAERIVEFLPCGLSRGGSPGVCALSVHPYSAAFTAPFAMERNAFIYAAAQATVVAECRLGEGGTWHGAVSALRRRSGVVLVPGASCCPGLEALASLGAKRFGSPAELLALVESAGLHGQPCLSGFEPGPLSA